jgi:hypothetical protein
MESKKTALQGTLEELDILDLTSKKRSNVLAFSLPTKDYKVGCLSKDDLRTHLD